MQYVYVDQQDLVDRLDKDAQHESPEDLIERLETALDNGSMTIAEVIEYLDDLGYNTKPNVRSDKK